MVEQITLITKFQQAEFDKALALVLEWDFSLLKAKLLEPDYAGWTEARVEKAETNYKRYLSVTKALSGYQLIPNGDIDRFWHEHILDTRRYAKDCSDLFGGFLHHYPYFGMRGDDDNKAWLDVSNISEELWKQLFDEPLYNVNFSEAQKCPQSCPGIDNSIQTSPQKCPQSCPGVADAIDGSYPYLPEIMVKQAA